MFNDEQRLGTVVIPRIAITAGEPAGIGPDILIQAAQSAYPAELVYIGDPRILLERAGLLRSNIRLDTINLNHAPQPHQPGVLKYYPLQAATLAVPGQLNTANSRYVLETIETACQLTRDDHCQAMVTAPVHKSIINKAGIPFTGHTEFLQQKTQSPCVVMLMVSELAKVALATTHLPLRQVPDAITTDLLTEVITTLHADLKKRFGLAQPVIGVCGLNPHAGEDGCLGMEEQEVIIPCLNALRAQGLTLKGPLPADTAFTEFSLKDLDAILTLYHDQGLPVIKQMDFHNTVNMTLGLPIIRTSVDHGTALDLAGKGHASAQSLSAAIRLSVQLASNR